MMAFKSQPSVFSKGLLGRQVTKEASPPDHLPVSSNPTPLQDVTNSSSSLEPILQVQAESNTRGLVNYVVRDDVTRAEILWSLKCIYSKFSYNSCRDLEKMFKAMFPDSKICEKFTLGATKVAYVICFGLAPHFQSEMEKKMQKVKHLVVCFDEAFNRIAQRQQMDILCRYWCEFSQKVCTQYLTSVFLGHTTAKDLLQKFKEGLGLTIKKEDIIQVSMDGPNVNWKFYNLLKEELREEGYDVGLLDMGSCGLHVIHGAYAVGMKKSGWVIQKLLTACYKLFKGSPARRADYIAITGSDHFPKKFCAHRWIENSDVISRVLDIWPNITIFVKEIKPEPTSASFSVIKEATSDRLLVAKLEFCKSMCLDLEPFLTLFQTEKPMAPFLYEQLYGVLYNLLARIVKKSSLVEITSCSKLMAININSGSKILKPIKEIDIGFGARKAIRNASKASELQKLAFFNECLQFLCACVHKICERSPLKHSFVRAISCLSPKCILEQEALAVKRLQMMLEMLLENGRITTSVAERSKQQYESLFLSGNVNIKEQLTVFLKEKSCDRRLDELYSNIFLQHPDLKELWCTIKLVLILSHGNATVESGFSINEDMLVENLKEKSLVAQRIVYDAIHLAGGVLSINIDKQMIQSVRGAHRRYGEELAKQKRDSKIIDDVLTKKKRMAAKVKELQVKKQKLLTDVQQQSAALDMEIAELKKL